MNPTTQPTRRASHRRPARRPSGVLATLVATLVLVLVSGVSATARSGSVAHTPEVERRSADGTTVVELLPDDPDDRGITELVARVRGATVLGRAPGVLLVGVPDQRVDELAGALAAFGTIVRDPVEVDARPETASVAPAQFGPTTGGAETTTNARAWHTAGITGSGVKIGVIDYFDIPLYWNSAEHGPVPIAGSTALCRRLGEDCTDDFFDGTNLGGEDHGIAVIEAILDMAPGAQIFIGQATSVSDYQALVDWFVANGVTVVSRSLGTRYDGPGDGRGPLDDIADAATAGGMLWVNSGGNNGEGKYYRHAVRVIANQVAFGPSGNDTFLEFSGCVRLAGVRWAADWDLPAAERTDYDIFLWESPTGNPAAGRVIDSGRRDQRAGASPLEHLSDDHCPDPGVTKLYLEVRLMRGNPTGDVLEVLDYGSGITEYTQSEGSAAVSIVDSANRGVLAAGALSPSGTIEEYSSRGPTNDGRIAPDISAPASYPSTVSGSFAGSSAAAPLVTGAAALMLEAGLAAGPKTLGNLLRNMVDDRGETGPDSEYGHGALLLPDPPTSPLSNDPSVFVSIDVPLRVLDTRPDTAKGPAELTGELWAGEILDLPIVAEAGLPPDEVAAVAINLVSTGTDGRGHLQAFPTLQAPAGGFSNLNIDTPGQVRANFAIVPVGHDGEISIRSSNGGHVLVDLLGWFRTAAPTETAGRFVRLTDAQRVMDSRKIAPVGPLQSQEVRPVPMPTGVDPELVDALVVTVTATQASDRGWVQILPGGQPAAVGTTSTINILPGDTVPNAAIVPVGTDGVVLTSSFLNAGSAHVIVDVMGYMTSSASPAGDAGMFVPLEPGRAYDSRDTGDMLYDTDVVTVDAGVIGVPDDATAVVWNLTATGAVRRGRAVGWAAGQELPPTSNLNWTGPNSTRAASAIIATTDGASTFTVDDGSADLDTPLTHFLTDVFGYFT